MVQKHLLNTQTAHMAVIHICAENRAEAVSSIKNGQRAERQERPDKLKPKLQLNTEHPVECRHSFVSVCGCVRSQSGRAVIATTCTMSDLPTKHFILHTGLTLSQHTHTRLLLPLHVEVEKRIRE